VVQEIGRLDVLAGDPAVFDSYRKAIRSGCDAGEHTSSARLDLVRIHGTR
jgi:hypothetical protein